MRKPVGLTAPYRQENDDDDIQDYKKPWVGLTEKEQLEIFAWRIAKPRSEYEYYKKIEKLLRGKNT